MLLNTFFTYIFWSALNSIHKGTLCRPPEFSCCSAFSFMVLSPVNSKCLVLLLFIRYVMSDSLKSQGLQHTRLLCPPLSPGVCSNSRPLSLWCYLTILCCFLSLPFPASMSFPVSQLFCIRLSKIWSFSFRNGPSNEYSWLISFRIDWFDLFVVQRTLKSLLQHHNSKASILKQSAFFTVLLSCDHWRRPLLDYVDFVGRIMSLLFNVV